MPEADGGLTARERAVIERIERRVPIKTIAAELGISSTRVNQHVRALKDHYSVNSLNELVETFREIEPVQPSEVAAQPGQEPAQAVPKGADAAAETPAIPSDQPDIARVFGEPGCIKDAWLKDEVSTGGQSRESSSRNESAEFVFSDALSFPVEAPWQQAHEPEEPAVVPGMLDGQHFVTARLLAMMGAAVGMMVLVVLVLTSFVSLGQLLQGAWHVPEENDAPALERGRAENSDAGPGQSGRLENT